MRNRIEKTFSGSFMYISGENDETECKYDITGYENIRNVYKEKSISEQELIKIISELSDMGKSIERKNLDINGFLVSPDYIYIDEKRATVYRESRNFGIVMIYYPGKLDTTIDTSLLRLAEFIIEKIDYNNQRAVDIAYMFYIQVYNGNYVFDTSLWK